VLRWHPKGKKDDRIKFSLEPLFSVHKIYFLDDQIPYDQMMKLTEQLQQFPESTLKDVIDVVSQ
jgi:phage terminase large subunit-like protein